MYRKGRGFGKNFIKAEEWLSKAAEGGSASAYHRLGWMYARGEISGSRNNKMAVGTFHVGSMHSYVICSVYAHNTKILK